MLLRLILWGILIYLLYRLIIRVVKANREQPRVQGRPKGSPPLDLSNMEVEDAHYEEIKEEKETKKS